MGCPDRRSDTHIAHSSKLACQVQFCSQLAGRLETNSCQDLTCRGFVGRLEWWSALLALLSLSQAAYYPPRVSSSVSPPQPCYCWQRSTTGLAIHAIPPPHPTIYHWPQSNTGLISNAVNHDLWSPSHILPWPCLSCSDIALIVHVVGCDLWPALLVSICLQSCWIHLYK